MKDELELLWTGLKVRVKDTFTSTFFVAWVIWNWRAILYIIYPMSMDLDARLHHIETTIYDDYLRTWVLLLIGPLLSALFFLLVLPWATNWVDKRYQGFLVQRRKNQVGAQSSLVYTSDELNEITEMNRKMRIELDQLRTQSSNQGMELYQLRPRMAASNAQMQILLKHMTPEQLAAAIKEGFVHQR